YFSYLVYFFFSSRRRHTRFSRDWSSDVCSSDLLNVDQNYFHSKLTTVDTIILEENEDCIISSIENLRIFDDFIFLIESAGGMVRSEERRVGKECRSRCLKRH